MCIVEDWNGGIKCIVMYDNFTSISSDSDCFNVFVALVTLVLPCTRVM